MIKANDSEQILRLCRAIANPTRLKIIGLLAQTRGMNLNELAERLKITAPAMTAHIRILEEAGIISIEITSGKRGIQKLCHLREGRFALDLIHEAQKPASYAAEIPIGSYSAYEARPTCGMATSKAPIGSFDDVRAFDDPRHIYAGILWLREGYIEYRLPNYMHTGQQIAEIELVQELAGKVGGLSGDRPSALHFLINGRDLGSWTMPDDADGARGIYTPSWWTCGPSQHGILKSLRVNHTGAFIDGAQIGNVTIDELSIGPESKIDYRIKASESAPASGGLTIYGRAFGNYNHGIMLKMTFEAV